MRKTLALTFALMATALLTGCVTPTPQEAQSAQEARLEAERLLGAFSAAMQAKDPSVMGAFLAPSLSSKQLMPLAAKFEGASWLKSYSGYAMEAGPVLDRVSWQRWQSGQVELTIPVSNADGGRFENDFVLARARAGWHIKDFTVDQPKVGDPVDPPAAVVGQVLPVIQQTMKALREGRTAEIWYSLPEDMGARYRMPVLSFWQKLSTGSRPISMYDDMNLVKRLPVAAWPDPSEPPEFAWLGPGAVKSVYELPYAWTSEEGPQTLRVELTFLRRDAAWTFYTLRFYGPAIPYSE